MSPMIKFLSDHRLIFSFLSSCLSFSSYHPTPPIQNHGRPGTVVHCGIYNIHFPSQACLEDRRCFFSARQSVTWTCLFLRTFSIFWMDFYFFLEILLEILQSEGISLSQADRKEMKPGITQCVSTTCSHLLNLCRHIGSYAPPRKKFLPGYKFLVSHLRIQYSTSGYWLP